MNEQYRHSLIQAQIYRQNILKITKCVIQNLLYKSQIHCIDDSCTEFQNFCAIIENALRHRLRASSGRKTWYGADEISHFWDYISYACWHMKGTCLKAISLMPNLKSSKSKGRAWLRMALLEKRLAEYFSVASDNIEVTNKFYDGGALMNNKEVSYLIQALESLNAIDFTVCIKEEDYEIGDYFSINYSPYLNFYPNRQKYVIRSGLETTNKPTALFCSEDEVTSKSSWSPLESDESGICNSQFSEETNNPWKNLYYKLEAMYRRVAEQKKHLEEKLKENSIVLEDLKSHNDCLRDALGSIGLHHHRESQHLQSVISELEDIIVPSANQSLTPQGVKCLWNKLDLSHILSKNPYLEKIVQNDFQGNESFVPPSSRQQNTSYSVSHEHYSLYNESILTNANETNDNDSLKYDAFTSDEEDSTNINEYHEDAEEDEAVCLPYKKFNSSTLSVMSSSSASISNSSIYCARTVANNCFDDLHRHLKHERPTFLSLSSLRSSLLASQNRKKESTSSKLKTPCSKFYYGGDQYFSLSKLSNCLLPTNLIDEKLAAFNTQSSSLEVMSSDFIYDDYLQEKKKLATASSFSTSTMKLFDALNIHEDDEKFVREDIETPKGGGGIITSDKKYNVLNASKICV